MAHKVFIEFTEAIKTPLIYAGQIISPTIDQIYSSIADIQSLINDLQIDLSDQQDQIDDLESDLNAAEISIQDLENNKQDNLGFIPEDSANKGQPSGYAPLDPSSKIPAIFLPSYVDDVIEGTLATLPMPGEAGKIYVDTITERTYRWSGSAYIEISPSPGSTDAVVEGAMNLYFTTARVLATLLTGLNISPGATIAPTDSILVAFGKLQAQINTLAALAPTADQKAALVGNHGAPSVGNRYVTESGLSAALTQAGAPVTRPINATAFIPSATKYVRGSYTVQIAASVSLGGSQSGTIFLETFNGATWDEVSRASYAWSGSVVIGLNLTSTVVFQLNGFFAPSQQVRLRSTGTATMTYIAGQESTIG